MTVVFVDLAESTRTGSDADPEVVRHGIGRCFHAATRAFDHHGGTVEGFIGDVVVAVFGVPTAHEDDAVRAVRAAVGLREAVAALNDEFEPDLGIRLVARVGINTGEVVVGEPTTGLTATSGDAVNLAARLQEAAGGGEVLMGDTTRRLLGDAARVEPVATLVLDGRGRPAAVWRLVGLSPGAPARTPERDRPIVGRIAERARLHAAFQRTARERRAARFTIIGEAGIGKSRLALEFIEELASTARVLIGRCPAYGEGITFWPLREIVLQAAGDRGRDGIAALLSGEDDAESITAQVAGAIGLSDAPGAGRELFPAVRRLFEVLAGSRPLVVVVDDAHWSQPTFLELIDYLAESAQGPVLIVCLARPELLDEHRTWVEERGSAASLVLEPLTHQDSETLVSDRLAGRIVPDDMVKQVVELAQGNPLFMEQLLAALRHEGELPIPPSVQALLAARLDRLGPAERDLLRCASVVGVEFSVEALTALVPGEARRFLDRHLQTLHRKELIRSSHRPFVGERGFAFRHVLVQLAAYRSTTRKDRSELHERFAAWLEREKMQELDEVVAYHLEQAHEQRRRLGLVDKATNDLAVHAGERLARAGLRAYGRYDMAATENLLSRARTLLPSDHPQRSQVMRGLAAVYPALGRLAEADAVLTEVLEDVRGHQDARLEQHIRLERLRIRMIAGPDPMPLEAIREEAERVLEKFGRWDDPIGMSEACYVLASVHLRSGRMRDLEEVARRGLAHAERSGDPREQLGAPWWVSWALVTGPTPVPDCIRSCEEILWVRGREHVGVLSDLARLRAMLGGFDEARGLVVRARREIVEWLRVRRALTVLAHRSAEVEIMAGDLATAEGTLRPALELAVDVGEPDQVSQIAADLSRVLAALGNAEEAATYASVSREHAPAESVCAQALWRVATARVLASRGEPGEAERLAREAVRLMPGDMLNLRADLHVNLAEILLATGQRDEARAILEEAVDLYEAKGNLVGAARARSLERQLKRSQTGDPPSALRQLP